MFFAVGYGKIYHRSDAGVWSDHTPGGIGSSHRIMSVWAPSPTEAYAVGYYYYTHGPIYYKWDGDSWGTWSVTPDPGANWRATHISAASRDEIYIVFYDVSDRNIKVWKGDYTGSGSYILEIGTSPYYANGCGYTAGENEFYLPLRGCSAPNTYMKKWNGSSWSDSANLPAAVVHIHGANSIFTTYGHASSPFSIYRWDGDSWGTDTSPANFYMQTYQNESDIWAYEDKCWIAGRYGTSNIKPAVAYYNGSSWSTITVNARVLNHAYCGIDGLNDEYILFATNKGYAYLYDGSSWTEEEIGATFDLQDVALDDEFTIPGTTESDLETKYGVHRNVFCKIHGVEPIFWKYSSLGEPEEPSDWTRNIKACLHAPTELSMDLNPVKGMADISALTLTVDDIKDSDGTYYFGKLFAAARWANNDHTWIVSDVAADATQIGVIDHADFDESGIAYISGETFSYTGKNTAFGVDIFTGITRDLYPSVDGISLGKYYRYPRPGEGGGQAVVATNPYTLAGRMIALYVVTYDRHKCRWNDESDAALTWVGRITDKIEHDGASNTWKMSCESLVGDFDKKISYKARKSPLSKVVNLAGNEDVRSFKIKFYASYGGGPVQLIRYTTVASITYGTISDIIAQLNWAFYSLVDNISAWTQVDYGYGTDESPALSIKLESGYITLDVEYKYASRVVIEFGDKCHLFQALGYNVGGVSNAIIELDGEDSPYSYSWKAPNKCYESYHPINPFFNGNSLCVDDTGVFISDQGDSPDGASAAVRIQDVKTSTGAETKATIYYRYGSTSYGSSAYETCPILVLEYDRGSRMQIPSDSYAAIGSRYGDDKQIYVEQIFIPYPYDSEEGGHRGPFTMLLMMLLSTGAEGYNHATYDVLREEFALGIPANLIDIDSFLNADKLVAANPLAARYLYPIEGKSFRELIEAECSLFGFAMVWQNGQFRIIEVMPPPISDYQATIDEDVIMDHIWQPKFALSVDQCINQYECYVNFDYLSNKFNSPITIQDVDSINELRKVLSHRVEHKGVWTHRLSPLPVDDLTTQLMGRYIRFPMPVVTLPIAPTLISKIFVGDVVKFQSDKFHDPFGSGTKDTDCYAQIISLSWNYSSWIGVCKLRLLSDVEQYGSPWAHTSLVDITATNGGWDAGAYQLTLVAYEFGDEDRDNKDGNQFAQGDYVTVRERAPEYPTSPQMWGPLEVNKDYEDDGTDILTLVNGTTLTGWDSTKEYVVTPGDYKDVAEAQKIIVYVANEEKKLETSVWQLSRYLFG